MSIAMVHSSSSTRRVATAYFTNEDVIGKKIADLEDRIDRLIKELKNERGGNKNSDRNFTNKVFQKWKAIFTDAKDLSAQLNGCRHDKWTDVILKIRVVHVNYSDLLFTSESKRWKFAPNKIKTPPQSRVNRWNNSAVLYNLGRLHRI